MSGLLSLKWNNHSTIFLNLLQNLRLKELYCDTTIVCQGKFFPVHKLVLSTCSEYFEEIFERIDCKHPFIIMKDVEIQQLEALLNYMYKGEVNVLQDCLSGLIKAAEALKIKGLAVPDQVNTGSESPVNLNSHSSLSPNSVDKTSSNNDQQNHAAEASKKKIADWGQKDSKFISKEYSNASEELQTIVKSEPIEFINECPDKQTNVDPLNFASLLPNEAERDNPKDKETVQQLRSNLTSSPASSYSMSDNLNDSSVNADESCHLWQDVASTSTEERIQRMESINSTLASSLLSVVEGKPSSLLLSAGRDIRKGYSCLHCSFVTKWKCNLRTHLRRAHTGEKPFRCSFCAYRSCSSDSLKVHIRTHTGEKPYQCPLCPHRTAAQNNLARHIRRQHKYISTNDESQN